MEGGGEVEGLDKDTHAGEDNYHAVSKQLPNGMHSVHAPSWVVDCNHT